MDRVFGEHKLDREPMRAVRDLEVNDEVGFRRCIIPERLGNRNASPAAGGKHTSPMSAAPQNLVK